MNRERNKDSQYKIVWILKKPNSQVNNSQNKQTTNDKTQNNNLDKQMT